ncbi:HoxA transcriptional regulator (plasmid) [Halorientalis sp. IM1011]|uniref:winged helix-turn-helix transcriptional regulator n=1 Tax=Halorientalis sp. IM1011 TaxID=1932360 RepID=UPI00097CC9EE|nr:winged helix-turn-helix transcriptional regulator [Halorientalis sp. IM1011]AQL44640.1 HoxA transcriptional regulator [Halorientalis sp. IM1011]
MDSGRDDPAEQVRETVQLISKKWHPTIIKQLLDDGPLRFSELQDRLDGISGKVLTDSLEDLVEKDLVERTVVSESPKRVEYTLTRDGRDLQSVMAELAEWGQRNLGESGRPTVLIVDDDPRLVRMHANWLEDSYDIERAYNGRQALRSLSAEVDVVLLDRRMPGLSGSEVLEKIRELNVDCRVVMLTAVEPDFDVAEMPFDAYVVKPGFKPELESVIEDMLNRPSEDEPVLEYLSLRARRALLESEMTRGELSTSTEYRRLVERLEELQEQLDEPAEQAINSETVHTLIDS